MSAWLIWGAAAALYALFRLWYDNWRGPLRQAEIEEFLAEVRGKYGGGNDPAELRAFLEADDGKEFVMLNLVRIEPGMVTDPATGQPMEGRAAMRRYSDPFVRALLRRGGHPLYVGRKVAGYIDAWNSAPDPGWTLVGTMRYRSRRDLVAMVLDPAFRASHPAKLLGLDATYSFPTQRMVAGYASPRVWMALLIALAAALVHLGFG